MSKVFLYVPYEEKERAKVLGAKYDVDLKSWYCDDGKKICIDEWSKRFVDVPYDKKDEFKSLGCKWDGYVKKWYTYTGNKNV